MLTISLRRSIVTAALVAGTIAGMDATSWPEWRGPGRDGRSSRDRPAGEMVAAGREPGLEGSVREPLVAGRVRQSGVHQHRGRRSRPHPGAAGRPRRRDREAALGAAVQHLSERRAPASRGVGVARRGSGHRQHLRLHRRRAALLRFARRQTGVGSIARRGLRRGHDARRPHHLADRRRRPGHSQYPRARVGRPQSTRQPLLRLRQAHRPDGVGELAAGAALRHQLFHADRRRSAAGPVSHRRRHRRRVSRAARQYRRKGLVGGSEQARDSQQRDLPRQRRLRHSRRREHGHHRNGDGVGHRRDPDRHACGAMPSSGRRTASCRRLPLR